MGWHLAREIRSRRYVLLLYLSERCESTEVQWLSANYEIDNKQILQFLPILTLFRAQWLQPLRSLFSNMNSISEKWWIRDINIRGDSLRRKAQT